MANANIKNITLIDHWPGYPDPNLGTPTDGWDSTTAGNKSVTAVYPVGTKIQGYQTSGNIGYYTMIYLRFFEGSGEIATGGDLSNNANFVCTGDATYAPDGTGVWWNVTNHCSISCATHDWANFAVACTTLVGDGTLTATATANAEYGWFWCGGVCPYMEVTAFAAVASAGAEFTGVCTDKSGVCIINDTSQLSIGGFTAGDGTCNCIGFATETAA